MGKTFGDICACLVMLVVLMVLVGCSSEVRQGTGEDTEPAAHRVPTTVHRTDGAEDETTATGPRAGWDYVALGDSLAVGVGARQGYVERYAGHLRGGTGVRLRVINLGISGQTSTQLLRSLRNDSSVRKTLGEAEVVTFDIGINDLGRAQGSYEAGTCGGGRNRRCLRAAVEALEENWDAIMGEISRLSSPDETVVRTAGLGYTPRAGRVFRPYLREANRHIASSAQDAGVPYTEVHLGDEEISPDGLHPNDRGYEEIAGRLQELGYEPLRTH